MVSAEAVSVTTVARSSGLVAYAGDGHGAAAEADHPRRGIVEQGQHERGLALAKARLALLGEELADAHAGLLGEARVGVDEGDARDELRRASRRCSCRSP